jgi:hypothetical protein
MPPNEQAKVDAYWAQKRLDTLAKLFIVPHEHRPPASAPRRNSAHEIKRIAPAPQNPPCPGLSRA